LALRHPSAIKRNRQNIKQRARNRGVQASVRTEIRKLREIVAQGDQAAAEAELRIAVRDLSKAATKGVIHRNAASRRIARLSRHVANMRTPAE
jgi:small subunit ribosomal protein S20